MRMTSEEFDAAGERSVEDPSIPLPLPCATRGCEEEVLEYGDGIYYCPVCGRMVLKEDAVAYLEDIIAGKYDD